MQQMHSGPIWAAGAALMMTNGLLASAIVPVSQQRNVTADSIVSSPSLQDIEFFNAPDFNEFNASAASKISNSNALAQTSAVQHSMIEGCGIFATGDSNAEGQSGGAGFHGYSIGISHCHVVFDITDSTEFLIAGSIVSGSHGQASVTLQAIPQQLLFMRTIVGDTLDVHHRITLDPGRYAITYQALATVAANEGASMNDAAHFDLQMTHCFIPADTNNDGMVNVTDLLDVINGWGTCPREPQPCAADVTLDGLINVNDLLAVINAWGS